MTQSAFIIGNGPSRESVDLDQLRKYGKIFGCNALHRTFTPDYLFLVDKKISYEVFANKVHERCEVWTTETIAQIHPFIGSKYIRGCSGASALHIAARKKGYKRIYLLGMDFWACPVHHNLYSGSLGYRDLPVSEACFKKQEKKWDTVLNERHFPKDIKIIRVVPENHVIPNCFKNIEHIDLELFKEYFNGS